MAGLSEMNNRECTRLRQAYGATSCESTRMKSKNLMQSRKGKRFTEDHKDGFLNKKVAKEAKVKGLSAAQEP
jgi:hypothetical protein